MLKWRIPCTEEAMVVQLVTHMVITKVFYEADQNYWRTAPSPKNHRTSPNPNGRRPNIKISATPRRPVLTVTKKCSRWHGRRPRTPNSWTTLNNSPTTATRISMLTMICKQPQTASTCNSWNKCLHNKIRWRRWWKLLRWCKPRLPSLKHHLLLLTIQQNGGRNTCTLNTH